MFSDIQNSLTNSPFLAIFLVFCAGAFASLSSCSLIRIPIVFGYIASSSDSKRKAHFLVWFFVLGLVVSYTVFGIFLGLMGNLTSKLIYARQYIFLILGILLVIAGIFMSGLIMIKSHQFHVHVVDRFKRKGFLGAFFFGMALALIEMPTCPCCAPLLLIIASTAFMSGSFVYAVLVCIVFALGQSLPTILIGMSTSLVKYLTPRIAKFESYIRLVAGNILIVVGIFFIITA